MFAVVSGFLLLRFRHVGSRWLPLYLVFFGYFFGQSLLAAYSRMWDIMFRLQVLLFAHVAVFLASESPILVPDLAQRKLD